MCSARRSWSLAFIARWRFAGAEARGWREQRVVNVWRCTALLQQTGVHPSYRPALIEVSLEALVETTPRLPYTSEV
jgi:hypothetical protein